MLHRNVMAVRILRICTALGILLVTYMAYASYISVSNSGNGFHSCFFMHAANSTYISQLVNLTKSDAGNLLGQCAISALNTYGQSTLNSFNVSDNLTNINRQFDQQKQKNAILSTIPWATMLVLLILIFMLSYRVRKNSA